MGRHAFTMSKRKLQEIRQEEERKRKAEEKERKAILQPPRFFTGNTAGVKLKKIPTYKHRSSDMEVNRPNGGFSAGVAAKVASPVYTGDRLLGIAVMHKSCLQPIFTQEEAIASSTMRRG